MADDSLSDWENTYFANVDSKHIEEFSYCISNEPSLNWVVALQVHFYRSWISEVIIAPECAGDTYLHKACTHEEWLKQSEPNWDGLHWWSWLPIIFAHNPLCGPYTSANDAACLDSTGVEGSILVV